MSVTRMRVRLALPVLLVSLASGTAYPPAPVAAADSNPAAQVSAAAAPPTQQVCAPAALGYASCLSLLRTDLAPLARSLVTALTPPAGYGPAELLSAYALPGSNAGAGKTVAIVDAYDLPTAASDLATYRAQYRLPPCTTANGCFRKVNQSGGTTPPKANSSWGTEIALDIEMVSAVCPSCKILLVEATSNSLSDLGTAVNEAVTLGAVAVSNSYGGGEWSTESSTDATYYDHPGVAVTASSGDGGYGVEFPAASPHVVAVGGTTLNPATNARGWTETAWDGAGSGCSAYEPKPAWQADSGCSRRTVADVSAVADPATGVAAYDSYGQGGWVVLGGTSVASPIIASTYALAGTPVAGTYPGSYLYASPAHLNDVTNGSNGTCSPSYLCTARPGYDGPTGLGTPAGTGTFTAPVTTITSITPANGPTAGGTTVTIMGTGLTAATAVHFGGTAAASFTVTSGTQISAVSPAGSGTVDITVTGPGGTSTTSSADRFTYLPDATGATYVSLSPARLLDTRNGTGLSGAFSSGVSRTFAVTGQGGVPANAVAVTGNLTVTQQTSAGFVALTPSPTNAPATSTLNFPLGDNRANGVTVALSGTGTLSATYMGEAGPSATTQLIFDVTGYFVP